MKFTGRSSKNISVEHLQSKSAFNIFQDTISKPNYDYDGAKMIIATKNKRSTSVSYQCCNTKRKCHINS